MLAARGLELISEYQNESFIAEKWRSCAQEIRAFIEQNCKTSTGAYAVYAGSDDVDVSAALFPAWSFDDPCSEDNEGNNTSN